MALPTHELIEALISLGLAIWGGKQGVSFLRNYKYNGTEQSRRLTADNLRAALKDANEPIVNELREIKASQQDTRDRIVELVVLTRTHINNG